MPAFQEREYEIIQVGHMVSLWLLLLFTVDVFDQLFCFERNALCDQ